MTAILDQIRHTLREANIVSTERQFCELWLGKSECYTRSLRFTQTAPSPDALSNCAARLAWVATQLRAQDTTKHRYWAEQLEDLQIKCYQAMGQLSQNKWRQKGVAA